MKTSAALRRCEHCGRAMSARLHRQRHPATGAKVCSNCINLNTPEWTMTYAAQYLPPEMLPEFTKRQNEAIASMMAVAAKADRMGDMNTHLAHDSGEGADLSHCPFCGSGGIIGGSDGTVTCQFCFSGETEFLTWDGIRTLKETVGTIQTVLAHDSFRTKVGKGKSRTGNCQLEEDQVIAIRDAYLAGGITKAQLARDYGVVQGSIKKVLDRSAWAHVGGGGVDPSAPPERRITWAEGHNTFGGVWVQASIESFGVQPLLRVVLTRAGVEKVVYATAEHRWFIHPKFGSWHKPTIRETVLTEQLKAGDALVTLLPRGRVRINSDTVPSAFGIARGFTFGDGSLDNRGGSTVTCWGEKDTALLPYFAASPQTSTENKNGTRGVVVKGLPAYFKDRPPSGESLQYLYGWLAGYFAADGCVSGDGSAAW